MQTAAPLSFLATISACLAFEIAADAQQLIRPIAQDRLAYGSVDGYDFVQGAVQEIDDQRAPDFGPWFGVASVNLPVDGAVGTGGGEHDSVILDDAILGTGNMYATAEGNKINYAEGACQSRLEVTFLTDEPLTWTLTGNVGAYDNSFGIVSFGSSTEDFFFHWVEGYMNLSEGGVIPPGEYTLQVFVTGDTIAPWLGYDYASGDFDVEFRVARPEPGIASCFGAVCPCGNVDPVAGCANSTGVGGLLSGSGGTSATVDDLVLTASQLPPNNNGLFYMGDALVPSPFFDGLQCALGYTFRFLSSIQSTGVTGTMTLGPGVAALSAGNVVPGSTWHFHAWHRDVPGSPCGTGANLTNVYSVSFTP